MKRIYWNKDKIKLLESYLKQGKNYTEIANLFCSTYKAIESALRRYGLKKISEYEYEGTCKNIKSKKLNYDELKEAGIIIGRKLVEEYKPLKLPNYKTEISKSKREEKK